MDKKTVLIISEHPADFGKLTAALSRAEPQRFDPVIRFDPVTIDTRDQPVAALMDPGNDAVILAYTPETEYLLRLAKKKNLTLPIIAVIDEESESLPSKLNEAGATDYILREHIGEDRLYRKLTTGLGLDEFPSQRQREAEQREQPELERATEQSTPGTGAPIASVEPVAPAIDTAVELKAGPEPAPAKSKPMSRHAGKVAPLALGVAGALAAPWKVSIVATIVGLVLVSGNLVSQRLDSGARLARLEASNDLLSRQLLQLHSDLTQIALAPAKSDGAFTAPDPLALTQAIPAPASVPAPSIARQKDRPPVQMAAAHVVLATPAAAAPAPPGQVHAAPLAAPVQIAAAGTKIPEADRRVPITPIAGASDAGWFINLGTFSSRGAARRFANSLKPSSHKQEIQGVVVAGKQLYRVRVVDLPSVEVAEALAMDYQITLGGGRPWLGQN